MFKKILVPVDVSVAAETQKLLQASATLADTWGAQVHVATVIPDVGMAIVGSYFDEGFEAKNRDAAKIQLAEAISAAGIDAKQHLLTGTVYESVIDLASDLGVDLIVVGAQQPKLRDYLLGANAAKVVRHAKQSVLVIRDQD